MKEEDMATTGKTSEAPKVSSSEFTFDGMVIDDIQTPLWVFDIDRSRIAWANKVALQLWNADTLEELTGRDMSVDMSTTVSQRLKQYQEDFIKHGASFTEVWTIYPDGKPTTLNVLFRGYRLPDGRMGMICEVSGERKDAPESLRSAEALTHTSLMISLYDSDGMPLYFNPAARATNFDLTANVSTRFVKRSAHQDLMAELRKYGGCRRAVQVRTNSGIRWHEITARECSDAVTGKPAFLFSEVDISELKETEQRMRHIADHDLLTGLPNRHFIQSTLPQQLKAAKAANEDMTLLIIDLDNFKAINDTLGHAAGDDLLIAVADRLKRFTAKRGMVARLGGDEFLIWLKGAYDEEAIRDFCTGLNTLFTDDIMICNRPFSITLSIGISRFPKDGDDLNALLKNGDMALYEAKETGRNTFRHFSTALRNKIEEQHMLENDLRSALRNEEFDVYFQPRVDTFTNMIVGGEALLRWHHPEKGLLTPGVFIATCEETGLIHDIGEFVLTRVGETQHLLQQSGHPIPLSVNLSASQLTSASFIDAVVSLEGRTGCNPKKIELEITESMLMQKNQSMDALRRFRELGYGIAIDDFGTGYSNLAYIQRNTITSLKIDRSFISDIKNMGAVTQLVLSLCRMLKVKAVAEGVETMEQLQWLRDHNCMEFQGFLFSPAVPLADFRAMLDQPPKLAQTQQSGGNRSSYTRLPKGMALAPAP